MLHGEIKWKKVSPSASGGRAETETGAVQSGNDAGVIHLLPQTRAIPTLLVAQSRAVAAATGHSKLRQSLSAIPGSRQFVPGQLGSELSVRPSPCMMRWLMQDKAMRGDREKQRDYTTNRRQETWSRLRQKDLSCQADKLAQFQKSDSDGSERRAEETFTAQNGTAQGSGFAEDDRSGSRKGTADKTSAHGCAPQAAADT